MNEKFKSRKFIITIWAALNFTSFGIISLLNGNTPAWMGASMAILSGIVGAYVGFQAVIDNKSVSKEAKK